MRLSAMNILLVVLVVCFSRGAVPTAQAPSAQESWRSSWTSFAQATKDFLEEERRIHPDKPEFPEAGRSMLSMGEPTPPNSPVMKRFGGPLVFRGKFTKVITTPTPTDQLMPGQPYKLKFEMAEPGVRGWLLNPDHVYPKASDLEKWKAMPIGTVVTFRTKLTGIGATGLGDQYFCTVLLTDAEPIEVK